MNAESEAVGAHAAEPSGRARRSVEVELMTRAGCAACARAERELARILADYGLSASLVDVDERADAGDPLPRAEYGDRVPVVVVDGVEHSYWEVDEPRLRSDLDARR